MNGGLRLGGVFRRVCEETEGFLMKAASCVAWLEWRGSMPKHVQCGSGAAFSSPLSDIWTYYCLCILNTFYLVRCCPDSDLTLTKNVTIVAEVALRTLGRQLVGTFIVHSEGTNMDLHTRKKIFCC